MIKPEIPARGILKKLDEKDAVWYEVFCDCGSNDHVHSIWVEFDKEINEIIVHIQTETSTDNWTNYLQENKKINNEFLFQIWWRLAYLGNEIIRRSKLISTILFRGYIKYNSTLILNKQQALNYSEALKKSIGEMSIQK